MGKSIRVSGLVDRSGGYHLLVEQRGNPAGLVIYSNNSVALLTSAELQAARVEQQYEQLCDGYGLLGNLSHGAEHSLLVATGILSVGRLGQSEVYRVTQVRTVSLRGHSGDTERLAEVVRLLTGGAAHFSWSSQGPPVDLASSAQRQAGGAGTGRSFLWSRLLALPFTRAGLGGWLVGLVVGSVNIRTLYVGATQLRAALISRLSSGRAGTRYQTRGLDDQGNAANFVETEQLLLTDSATSSFLQVRGSVHLFWEQPGLNVGSHKVKMSRGSELTQTAFDKHFEQLTDEYSDVIILNLLGVNLVGSKEGEANLSTAYQQQQRASKYSNMKHVLWDFHAEGGIKNLDKLWTQIQENVQRFGQFSSVSGAEQRGVVRTNCMDCLDRSNVTQSFIAAKMLDTQLASLGIEVKESTVSRLADMYQQMWTSNGNTLSKMYAGTAALSQGGSIILDGARSAARTIQNNLLDGDKQEAFDLILQGAVRQTDFRDRARLILPRQLYHGNIEHRISIMWIITMEQI